MADRSAADLVTVRARVADWVVECRSPSASVFAEFRRVLGPAPGADPGLAPDLIIEAFIVLASEMPSPTGWTIVDEDESATLWTTPEGAAMTLGGSVAVFAENAASLFFASEQDVVLTLHSLVTAALNHRARVDELVPTHSALIGVDGVWLLLLGPSGVGKSTSCLAASTGGLEVASDDTCLLKCVDGQLLAHGLPRAPSLPRVEHGLGDGGAVDHRSRTSEPDFELVDGWHRVSSVLVLEHGSDLLSTLGTVPAMKVIEAITASVAGALSVDIVMDTVPDVLRAVLTLPARSLALGADASRRLASTSDALVDAASQV